MTTAVICKLLRSKEAMATVDIRNWPPVLDTGTNTQTCTTSLFLTWKALHTHAGVSGIFVWLLVGDMLEIHISVKKLWEDNESKWALIISSYVYTQTNVILSSYNNQTDFFLIVWNLHFLVISLLRCRLLGHRYFTATDCSMKLSAEMYIAYLNWAL